MEAWIQPYRDKTPLPAALSDGNLASYVAGTPGEAASWDR